MKELTRVYTNGSVVEVITDNGRKTLQPCMLFVTYKGNEVSIKGLHNPLPFKKATITESSISIDTWLQKHGWIEVAYK